jgi:hypothetical protein
LRRNSTAPDALALGGCGVGEVDGEAQPTLEGLVERGLGVGGENGDALELLHALQQIADFDVGVAVMAVANFRALAEERLGLVEEQHDAALLGGIEGDKPEFVAGLVLQAVEEGQAQYFANDRLRKMAGVAA